MLAYFDEKAQAIRDVNNNVLPQDFDGKCVRFVNTTEYFTYYTFSKDGERQWILLKDGENETKTS